MLDGGPRAPLESLADVGAAVEHLAQLLDPPRPSVFEVSAHARVLRGATAIGVLKAVPLLDHVGIAWYKFDLYQCVYWYNFGPWRVCQVEGSMGQLMVMVRATGLERDDLIGAAACSGCRTRALVPFGLKPWLGAQTVPSIGQRSEGRES